MGSRCSHSVICHPTEKILLDSTSNEAGTQFIDTDWMKGRVDLDTERATHVGFCTVLYSLQNKIGTNVAVQAYNPTVAEI